MVQVVCSTIVALHHHAVHGIGALCAYFVVELCPVAHVGVGGKCGFVAKVVHLDVELCGSVDIIVLLGIIVDAVYLGHRLFECFEVAVKHRGVLRIDKVSDVNGCLAIVDKNTLETTRGYHLDVKAIDVKVHENRLVMTCFYGFNVYDITDPSNPLLTYSYRTNNFKEFQNCCIYENNGKVYVIICNYSQGYMIAEWNGENLYNKIYSFDVVVDYPYAYFTSSTMSAYRNTDDDRRGVMTVNLTNITSPTSSFSFVPQDKITTATNGDPQPTHIAKIGNRLLVNNGEKGLLIFNTSGGEAIYESALSLPEQSFANQIFVSDQGRVFVNDGASGGTNYPGRNIYLIGGF